MSRFTHDTEVAKKDLIERAIKCKPNHIDSHATHRGWECIHPNGNKEVLVSFGGLDKLLLDESTESPQEPLETVVLALSKEETETPTEVILEVTEASIETEEYTVSDEEEGIATEAPKKRGRPKVAGA